MNYSRKLRAIILTGLLLTSFILHIYRISIPSEPVFDEVHFATYAADYLNQQAFFDIHPPLGKLLFAGVLAFFPRGRIENAKFISFSRLENGGISSKALNDGYRDFPYIALRLFSSFVGIALILAFYLFLKAIGIG